MTNSTAGEVVARLEAATEGSEELDALIAAEVGFDGWTPAEWADAVGPLSQAERMYCRPVNCPRYTTSLDAAMTLVPDGYFWRMGHVEQLSEDDEVMYGAELLRYLHVADRSDSMGHGLTAPLALCAAAMKARAPMNPQDDGSK